MKQRKPNSKRTYVSIKQKKRRLNENLHGSVAAKKAKPDDSSTRHRDENWIKRSYFWFGALSYDTHARCMSWKGSWLTYVKSRPTAEQLQWSRNHFDYAGPVVAEPDLTGGALRPLSGKYTGTYLADEGGRQERFTDSFELDFREIPGSQPLQYTVVGLGTSDFGRFVIDGAYDSGSKALGLSRNFVKDSDALGSMSLNELKQFHGRQLTAVELVVAPAAAAAIATVPPTRENVQAGQEVLV